LGALAEALWHVYSVWPFTTDDAYITLRYSKNLAEGAGLTFNPGEPPVEGYSNFSFVLLGAASLWLHRDPVLVLKALDVLSLCATLLLVYLLGRRHLPALLAAVPVWFLAMYKGTSWWTVSGLETTFAQLLFTIAVFNLDTLLANNNGASSRLRLGILGIALLGLALTRPEGSPLSVLVLVILACSWLGASWRGLPQTRRFARELGWFAALLLTGLALYHGFRFIHFHRLLPNTVRCKAAYDGDPLTLQRELWQAFAPCLVLASVALLRKRSLRVVALVSPLLMEGVLFLGVDPIIGHFSRHFLPVMPGVLVAATIGLSELGHFLVPWRYLGTAATALAAWLIAPASDLNALRVDANAYAARQRLRGELARWIDLHLPDGAHVVLGDCGLIPYRSSRKFIDVYCLNSLQAAAALERHAPREFSTYALATRPEAIIIHSESALQLSPRSYRGVFPALVGDPRFASSYTLSTKFIGDSVACYWVFLRKDLQL
jgi:hypothetical protein